MRIYTSANDPLDFCRIHMPTEEVAWRKYGNLGDGPDGRNNCFAYEAEHPPYKNEEYHCEVAQCNKWLDEEDD